MSSKVELRKRFMAMRDRLTPSELQMASQAAQRNLIRLDIFEEAGCIALYAPCRNETDTRLLFETARSAGKKILYPEVRGGDLLFRQVLKDDQLVSGSFGIMEPCQAATVVPIEQAELVVLPGLAFDLAGYRVGFGKGFYDRALAKKTEGQKLVGLCHDFQLVRHVPSEPHDICMQYLVTEQRVLVAGTGLWSD